MLMKKLQAMYAKMNGLMAEASALNDSDTATLEEINAKAQEIKTIQAKITSQEMIDAEAKGRQDDPMTPLDPKPGSDPVNMSEVLARVLIGQGTESDFDTVKNLMSEGEDNKGGLTVPPDLKVEIKELQRKFFDVRNRNGFFS